MALQPFEMKKQIKEEREAFLSAFRDGSIGAYELTQQLSGMVDRYVTEIAEATLGNYRDKVALVYTGSNGRHEVCPYSDLDLAIILDEGLEIDSHIGANAELDPDFYENAFNPFMIALTDSGFVPDKVWPMGQGYAMHMMLSDQENWTQFIDRRFLGWGNSVLYDDLDQAIQAASEDNKLRFFEGKFGEYDKRLQKPAYGERSPEDNGRHLGRFTVLEPDVKNGYGGLRGYQTAQWVAHEQCGAGGCDVARRGLISEEDEQLAQKSHEFLLAVRCHLHDLEGKEKDRMEAHRQHEIAERMGYDDATSFMRDYIQHTRHIAYYAKIICCDVAEQNGIKPPGDFGDGYLRFDNDTISQPIDILNIYKDRLEGGHSLHHSAIREIRHNLDMLDGLVDDPDANRVMLDILSNENCEGTLRYMNVRGVLPRMIPEFDKITALTHYDPHHTYTVDEHSIVALGHLGKIINQDHSDIVPLASVLSSELSQSDKEVLSVVLLLHDVRKAEKPDNEGVYSEALMREVSVRLGLSEEQTEMAGWLGRNHLLLSHTARYHDIEDPTVVQEFVKKIPGQKHLNNLMVLTAADSLALGPGRLPPHAAHKIESLYQKTHSRMQGLTPHYNVQSSIQLPDDYIDGEPYVSICENTLLNSSLITVITSDKPYLMENITGALAKAMCSTLDARVTTISNGNVKAINQFLVQDSMGGVIDQYARDGVKNAILRAVESDEQLRFDVKKVNADTQKKNRVYPVEPSVEFSNALSDDLTLVKITARDRADLLHVLASEFNDLGLEMRHATITTQGHIATDVFNLKMRDGGQMPKDMQQDVRAAIMQHIQEEDPAPEV